jgi:hypothetical protein
MILGSLNDITAPGTITIISDDSGFYSPGDIVPFDQLIGTFNIGDIVTFYIDITQRTPTASDIVLYTPSEPNTNNTNMVSNNLNIVLTNALCCISTQAVKVSKLYSIGSDCAESELQKLKLMNDWFEALRCYNAEESTNSKFVLKLEYNQYLSVLKSTSNIGRLYVVTINGVEYSVVGDGVTSVGDLVGGLILSATGINSLTEIVDPDSYNPRHVYIYIDADCDIETINYQVIRISDNVVLSNIDWTLYEAGQCTVTNCLTEEQFNNIVAKLMAACGICECQLTQ